MPPGGGRGEGGEHGWPGTVPGHPPPTIRRDEDALPHSTPPLPVIVPVPSEEKKLELEQEQQPAPSLPEGALVEILSRVPYRSLCRFKCVSKPWFDLCFAPDIRRRSPQALSGFFYDIWSSQPRSLNFCNLNGRGPPLVDPSLPFLRQSYETVEVEHCCDGLLLCNCWKDGNTAEEEGDYVVCNPATQEWTVLPPVVFPDQDQESTYFYLGFEAAVPSRFVVFATPAYLDDDSAEVGIYSSQTGRWTYMQNKWASADSVKLTRLAHVFLNGTMHLITISESIVTVDAEGKVWRQIQMPDDTCYEIPHLGQSQGHLYLWQTENSHDCQLYIWVLEDYGTGKWTLKHTVNVLELFGRDCCKDDDYYWVFAIHPDYNVIFLTIGENMTLSYNMDNKKVHVICTEGMYGLPYVPCFAEWPSAGTEIQWGIM